MVIFSVCNSHNLPYYGINIVCIDHIDLGPEYQYQSHRVHFCIPYSKFQFQTWNIIHLDLLDLLYFSEFFHGTVDFIPGSRYLYLPDPVFDKFYLAFHTQISIPRNTSLIFLFHTSVFFQNFSKIIHFRARNQILYLIVCRSTFSTIDSFIIPFIMS